MFSLAYLISGGANAGDIVRFQERGAVCYRHAVAGQNALQNWLDVRHDLFRRSTEYYLVTSQIQRLHCRNKVVLVGEFVIQIQAGSQLIIKGKAEVHVQVGLQLLSRKA